MKYQTGEGEGKRNLGSQLRLKEDLYAVLFCSTIKAEYREHESTEAEASDVTQRPTEVATFAHLAPEIKKDTQVHDESNLGQLTGNIDATQNDLIVEDINYDD